MYNLTMSLLECTFIYIFSYKWFQVYIFVQTFRKVSTTCLEISTELISQNRYSLLLMILKHEKGSKYGTLWKQFFNRSIISIFCKVAIKTYILTHFWNNLHQVRSRPKYVKAKFRRDFKAGRWNFSECLYKYINLTLRICLRNFY
jgi:hypothetical protein